MTTSDQSQQENKRKRSESKAANSSTPTPQLTDAEALARAELEGLTLQTAPTRSGYVGVFVRDGRRKPYEAQIRGAASHKQSLGCYESAVHAALVYERARVAADRPAPTRQLSDAEALHLAEQEGLTLEAAPTPSGYVGVFVHAGRIKPYEAQIRDAASRKQSLGCFESAAHAALVYARAKALKLDEIDSTARDDLIVEMLHLLHESERVLGPPLPRLAALLPPRTAAACTAASSAAAHGVQSVAVAEHASR